MQKTVRRWIRFVEGYANRWWYSPLIAVLAAADSFVVIVPTDGLLVSAAMLAPRRWISTALFVSVGSSLGALGLALVLERHGLPWLLYFQPDIQQTSAWIYTDRLMDAWGSWAIFAVSLTPIMQQPAVALAALAGRPMGEIFFAALAGRAVKYGLLAWVSTHAPGVLGKLWGFKGDLEEAGVKTTPDGKVIVEVPPPHPVAHLPGHKHD
jgi:membrane protein YqaA with SNARE-associated domain